MKGLKYFFHNVSLRERRTWRGTQAKKDGVRPDFLSKVGDEVIFSRSGKGRVGGLRGVESLGRGVLVGLRKR